MYFKTKKRFNIIFKLIFGVLCLSLTVTHQSFGDDNIPIPTPNASEQAPTNTPSKGKIDKKIINLHIQPS